MTNLGFGFDYVDNAYYRVANGELNGIAPRLIIVNIGTNNLGHRGDSAEACAANVAALLTLIRATHPDAQILLFWYSVEQCAVAFLYGALFKLLLQLLMNILVLC